jgi:polysaccharide pyruvyl transferase CsaB
VLGYYGFGNWGDELSLLASLRALEKIGEESGRSFSYRVLLRHERPLIPFPADVEVVSREHFLAVLRKIRTADAVVVGGGSLLQDASSFRSLLYYLVLLRWALLWRKPLLFYGCGLGPFRHPLSRFMVSSVLRRAFLILRDEESKALALQLGAALSRTFLGVDPVFSLRCLSPHRGVNSGKLAVFLRSVDHEKEEALFLALQALCAQGVEMELAAFHRELDESVVERFARRLGVPGIFFADIEAVFRYFETVEMVFSLRLHPLVLATMRGIPWVALNVDPKIEALASFFDKENLLSWEQLSPQTLVASYQKRHGLREKTKTVGKLLCERAQTMQEHLRALLLR